MRLVRNGKEISAKLISNNPTWAGTVKPIRQGGSWASIRCDLEVDEGFELIEKYEPTPQRLPSIKGKVHCVDEWSKARTPAKKRPYVQTKRWTPSLRKSDFE